MSDLLTELADLGMSLARDLHASALATDDAATKADLAHAFDRIARSVRMSLALKAKLERDAKRQDREDTAEKVRHRKAQVRHAAERLIWTETESEDLLDELDDAIDAVALDDDFATAPIDTIIDRIHALLGLDPPPGRSPIEGEAPPDEPERRRGLPPNHPWRSSA